MNTESDNRYWQFVAASGLVRQAAEVLYDSGPDHQPTDNQRWAMVLLRLCPPLCRNIYNRAGLRPGSAPILIDATDRAPCPASVPKLGHVVLVGADYVMGPAVFYGGQSRPR